MNPTPPLVSRREVLAAGVALSLGGANIAADGDGLIGPLVGHTDATSAILWARLPKPGRYALTVQPAEGKGKAQNVEATATADADGTAQWLVRGLSPATKYTADLKGGRPCSFATAPANGDPARVTLAIGSWRFNLSSWSRARSQRLSAGASRKGLPMLQNRLPLQRSLDL